MQPKIFEPSKELATIIQCYWVLESSKEKTPQRNKIVPDGYMKMIFHYGDLYKHHTKEGQSYLLPRSFVIGQLTEVYEVEPSGDTGTFFVCFKPNGFFPFSTIPIKKMENTAISLKKLFGEDGQIIEQKIINAKTHLERINIIESFLFTQLTKKNLVKNTIKSAVETIVTANGQLSVDELGECLSINPRSLERQFSSQVGLSPKKLLKIIRLQTSLKMMLNKDLKKLSDIAYENEYFDQSHFNKDFKEFTGLTPKDFYSSSLKMSLIFDTLT
jgi:AraC-like DNA-binding protein